MTRILFLDVELDERLGRIRAVSAEDVRRVARTYLVT